MKKCYAWLFKKTANDNDEIIEIPNVEFQAQAQTQAQIPADVQIEVDRVTRETLENVCFKGGGVRGNAFLGVAKAFEELGIHPIRFIGSSAGAIFAAALACRIPYKDLAVLIENTDFGKMKDSDGWGVVGQGIRLVDDWGLYTGDYFSEWLRNGLRDHVGDSEITLQGVFERFGTELVITCTDLTKQNLVFLCRQDFPELKLRHAIRQSMSIPIFYKPVIVKDGNGLDHVIVDGGCTNNFPLQYFDNLYATPEIAFNKTIGFDLDNGLVEDPTAYRDQTVQINNVIDLVTALINTTITINERLRMRAVDQYRIIDINVGDVKATDFHISKATIETLAVAGYEACIGYF